MFLHRQFAVLSVAESDQSLAISTALLRQTKSDAAFGNVQPAEETCNFMIAALPRKATDTHDAIVTDNFLRIAVSN